MTLGSIINTRLISHPMNWVIILLMLIIAGIFGHLLLSILEQEPAKGNTRNLPNGYSAQPTPGTLDDVSFSASA